MNKSDWSAFVEANEQRTLTLTLAQRNLIADADQHIDWLESRKRFSEERVTQLLAACELALSYIEDGAPQTAADRLRTAITKAH